MHLKVKIPTKLTARQKELIEEFSKESGLSKEKTGSDGNNQSNFNLQDAWKRVKDFLHRDAKTGGAGNANSAESTGKGSDKDKDKESIKAKS